jgi:hypothetical protein
MYQLLPKFGRHCQECAFPVIKEGASLQGLQLIRTSTLTNSSSFAANISFDSINFKHALIIASFATYPFGAAIFRVAQA